MEKQKGRADERIRIEVYKDGRPVKVIDFGDDRMRARTMFFAMTGRPGPGRPVLWVGERELSASEATKYLKTGKL